MRQSGPPDIIEWMRSPADVSLGWSRGASPSSRRGLLTVALVLVAGLTTVSLVAFSAANELLAWDLRYAYLPAAEAIVEGETPYPALDDPVLEEQKGYVYPPQLAVALVPLSFLPVDVAAGLTTLLMLLTLGLTLHLLGVRDPACYAAALLWVPTVGGVLFSNVSLPLALALAVAWRYRGQIRGPGLALGLAVSAKLLLWPVLVWEAASGRRRVAGVALAVGFAVTFGTWSVLGFDGLAGYLDLLRRLDQIQSANSYSFVGMATELGLGTGAGRALCLLVGGALLGACILLARRGDELRSFTCAVAATLALSPIVWLHYLVLLLVPLAIAQPRFSPLWALPIVLWVSPKPGYADGLQTFAPGIVAAALLAALALRARRPAEPVESS